MDPAEETLDEDDGLTDETCSLQPSSNDTASDLPGHGRLLGLLYSRWGRALEAAAGRVARGSGHGPNAMGSRNHGVESGRIRVSQDTEPNEIDRAEEILCEDDVFTDILCSQQSSSNDTASNLPGPGRMLGLLYSRWGRALEVGIGLAAQRSGFGPNAMASRIKRVKFKGVRIPGGNIRGVARWTVKDGSEGKLRSDCRKLAKYATAEIWETRFEALAQIVQLTTAEPRLRTFFNAPLILLHLKAAAQTSNISGHGSTHWEDELKRHRVTKTLAKQALLVIEDFPQALFTLEDSQVLEVDKCKQIVAELLEYCRDNHSFIARLLKSHLIEVTSNVAASLQTRFERQSRVADLDGAIELYRAALRLLPSDHPKCFLSLNKLARSLQTRYKQYGQTADIDEAIEHRRAALRLCPDGHPDPSLSLNKLARSLETRYKQYGQTADIDEAIDHHRAALQLCPDGYPNRSLSLDSLAYSLRTRFDQYGQIADIDEAIDHHCTALQLYPNGHPKRSESLNYLVNSLRARSEQHERTAALNEAIEYYCDTLQLRLDGQPC